MKKTMIVLISTLILLGSISIASAAYIDTAQRVYFKSASSVDLYWAMIWDYGNAYKESSTPGFIGYATYLTYVCGWDSVQVAYIYSAATARYEEALALRDVNF